MWTTYWGGSILSIICSAGTMPYQLLQVANHGSWWVLCSMLSHMCYTHLTVGWVWYCQWIQDFGWICMMNSFSILCWAACLMPNLFLFSNVYCSTVNCDNLTVPVNNGQQMVVYMPPCSPLAFFCLSFPSLFHHLFFPFFPLQVINGEDEIRSWIFDK